MSSIFYNNKGVFGGIGEFGEYPAMPQYQDVLMYKTSKASLCAPDGSTLYAYNQRITKFPS